MRMTNRDIEGQNKRQISIFGEVLFRIESASSGSKLFYVDRGNSHYAKGLKSKREAFNIIEALIDGAHSQQLDNLRQRIYTCSRCGNIMTVKGDK